MSVICIVHPEQQRSPLGFFTVTNLSALQRDDDGDCFLVPSLLKMALSKTNIKMLFVNEEECVRQLLELFYELNHFKLRVHDV